jgi:hypothetical protein
MSVSNYRPVALLSTISKVFEKVVYKHIFNFLMENALIYKFQSESAGNIFTLSDLLNRRHKGPGISYFTSLSIVLLIRSGPTALLGSSNEIISILSCSTTVMSVNVRVQLSTCCFTKYYKQGV